MVKFCCVPHCRSRKAKDSKLLFHSFPHSHNLRKQWLDVVQQNIRKSPRHSTPFVIKNQTKVCSRHFLKTDYWHVGNVKKLRKSAVPTIFILPKDKDDVVSSTSKENIEQNPDTVLKEDKSKQASQNQMKNDAKPVKARPKSLPDLQKKKAEKSKDIKNVKDPKMIQNCRNLLLINKDHAYAALWQNESIENKNDKSSEDDTDNDETGTPLKTNVVEDAININLNTQEKVAVPTETVVEEEPAQISSNENNIEICSNIETPNEKELVNTATPEIVESIYFKEEIIEEFPHDIEESSICKSDNSIQNIDIEEETIVCNPVVESQQVSTVTTNVQSKNTKNASTLTAKPAKRINAISKKNLPEICILCATANMTRKNYTLIVHFAKIIMDLSGVDILKSNIAPIACNVCFKNVLEMWNFKQQIIAADKFITENIPKQPPIHTNAGNIPKPTGTTFEYIDCNKQNLNNTLIDSDSHRQPENVDDLSEVTPSKKNKKSLTINQAKSQNKVIRAVPKQKKDNGITLVPIENILQDNNTNVDGNDDFNDIDSESSEDCSDLPICTKCGIPFTDFNTKSCQCVKLVKKSDTQPEKFVCSTCGKQYPLLRSLKRHEVTHKKKQYLCTVCGQVFHFRLYLKRHMRKHSGKKPFACPYCNKKFSSQWNLSQHKRLHTNSMPYECPLCPTAFRHNVTLKKHVRLFHTADQLMQKSQHGTSSAISEANN